MNYSIKKIVLPFIVSLIISISVFPNTYAPKGEIMGNVADDQNQAIEFANVVLHSLNDSSIVDGTITNANGEFLFHDISFGEYFLKIQMIGYKNTYQQMITLDKKSPNLNLGTINLSTDLLHIDEVQVTGEKQAVEFKVDRKVINMDKLPNATGGTLAEALEDVPSIKTDDEGNVMLRGSTNFKVYIDGKPSLLDARQALKQIPADAVEQVELITNPSAKYDADGGAGIVNIIKKKNLDNGFNALIHGSVSAGKKYSGDLLMNYRINRVNLFLGADYRRGYYAGEGTVQSSFTSEEETRYESVIIEDEFNENDYIWTFGADIDVSSKNSFSFTGMVKDYPHKYYNNSFYKNWSDNSDTVITNRYNDKDIGGKPVRFTVSDIHKFDDNGHELTAYGFLGFKTHIDYHEFNRDTILSDTIFDTYNYRRETERPEVESRINISYTRPLTKDSKIETGYQFKNQYTTYQNNVMELNLQTNEWNTNSTEGSDLDYIKEEQAGFINYSNKFGLFSIQAGLRAEYYKQILRQDEQVELINNSKLDWFPSLFLSKEFKNDWHMVLNYGRRMNRLSLYSLSPIIYFDDGSYVYRGNPKLLPSYVHNVELELKGRIPLSTFILSEYFRDITNNTFTVTAIENEKRVRYPENFDKVHLLGVEFSAETKVNDFLKINTGSSFSLVHGKGEILEEKIEKSGREWDIQIRPTITFKTKTKVLLSAYYQSPYIREQGKGDGYYVTSISLKQQLFKDKMSLTFRVRDVLSSRKYKRTSEGANFFSESTYIPESPIYTFSFSYNLNSFKSKRGDIQDSGSGGGGGVF